MTNNLNLKNLPGFDKLSLEEKQIALKIIEEYSSKGDSKLLNNLIYEDYNEIPVDILTFVDDYNYLGNAWHDAEGKSKLYPYWRKELKKIFPDNLTTTVNNGIFSGSRGRGKMSCVNDNVLTASGFRKMGELKVGDLIYGSDGELYPILGVFPQGIRDIYEITFSDGTKNKCGLQHLWKIRDHHNIKNHKYYPPKWMVVDTQYLLSHKLYNKGVGYRYDIPICQPIKFPHKDYFIDPYILGLLLGDGCLKTRVDFTTADDELAGYFTSNVIKNNCKINSYNNGSKATSYYITSQNNIYLDNIKKLGLLGTDSYTKFIPNLYLYNDIESRIALLQGLLDTDGEAKKNFRRCDNTYSYNIIYNTISPQLKDNIIWLVQSLGGTASYKERESYYYKKDGTKNKCKNHYRINIKLPSNIQPFRLKRKADLYNSCSHKEPSRYITNIVKLDNKEECQCIYVGSEEHLYIMDDFIVTHNTEVATLIAAYLLHRLLCLKDPISYFHLKPTEKIVFAFMNIKLALAEEIGIAKFQNTLQSSPWFMSHGYLEGNKNKMWMPQKFNGQIAIDIKVGSQASDVIGLPIFFCLDGDTIINTSLGDFKIKDLENKPIQVFNIDDNGNKKLSDPCTVKMTGEYIDEYQIELEDGTVLKCTPNHKLKLKDGSYKEAKDLTEEDELYDL